MQYQLIGAFTATIVIGLTLILGITVGAVFF